LAYLVSFAWWYPWAATERYIASQLGNKEFQAEKDRCILQYGLRSTEAADRFGNLGIGVAFAAVATALFVLAFIFVKKGAEKLAQRHHAADAVRQGGGKLFLRDSHDRLHDWGHHDPEQALDGQALDGLSQLCLRCSQPLSSEDTETVGVQPEEPVGQSGNPSPQATTMTTIQTEATQRLAEALPRLFERYDINANGRLDTKEELHMLTQNVLYQIHCVLSEDTLNKAIDASFEQHPAWLPITMVEYKEWFESTIVPMSALFDE